MAPKKLKYTEGTVFINENKSLKKLGITKVIFSVPETFIWGGGRIHTTPSVRDRVKKSYKFQQQIISDNKINFIVLNHETKQPLNANARDQRPI